MKVRGGEFSTGTMGNFQLELTMIFRFFLTLFRNGRQPRCFP